MEKLIKIDQINECYRTIFKKDFINSGLAVKNLRDPDNGIHLARKKAQLVYLKKLNLMLKLSFIMRILASTLKVYQFPVPWLPHFLPFLAP